MNEDIHETVRGNPAENSAVEDEVNPMEPSNSTPSESLAKCEKISENESTENPVQLFSDQPDCDVEEVLQRTVDRVVTYGQEMPELLESDAPSAELAPSGETTRETAPIENMILQTSDNLHDSRNDCGDGDDGDKPGEQVEDTTCEVATHDDDGGDVDDDDDDDFGDFGDFSDSRAVEGLKVVTNGTSEPIDANVTDVRFNCEKDDDAVADDDDDDFGDFEEADFGKPAAAGPTIEFACFDDSPVDSGGSFVPDAVAPVGLEAFRSLITKLFVVVENSSNGLVDRPVESENFHACVHRDIARCEDVDNWPCVLFRYDSSRTRKTLLSSLCIDETPANCPRFAIDCLSNEFLQPVKESKGGSLPTPGNARELSEKAKEVLNKIPDLSFMKAEVLTFPATVQAP